MIFYFHPKLKITQNAAGMYVMFVYVYWCCWWRVFELIIRVSINKCSSISSCCISRSKRNITSFYYCCYCILICMFWGFLFCLFERYWRRLVFSSKLNCSDIVSSFAAADFLSRDNKLTNENLSKSIITPAVRSPDVTFTDKAWTATSVWSLRAGRARHLPFWAAVLVWLTFSSVIDS